MSNFCSNLFCFDILSLSIKMKLTERLETIQFFVSEQAYKFSSGSISVHAFVFGGRNSNGKLLQSFTCKALIAVDLGGS